jgi:uncharacterized membrane protein YbhN (UPF0104 family)
LKNTSLEQNKKPNPLKTFITIAISMAIALFFMWFALRDMEVQKIAGYFEKANYFWVLIAAIFGGLAYWFRAIRWNLLLEPMGYKISNSNSFWTLSFGYLMNLTIPRSGELARSTALYGVEKIPVDKSFGTIILERVVDLICMMGFLGLTLLFKYEAIISFYQYVTEEKKKDTVDVEPNFFEKCLLYIGVQDFESFYFYLKSTILILIILIIAYLFINKREQLINFIKGIFTGLFTIFKLKKPIKFIILSLAIWVCYYLAAYVVCFALPETSQFTFADGFFIIVVGTLGMMVPASGGIGAFHFALKLGIMALFLSMGKNPEEGAEVGLAYAFISHTMQLVLMIVLGLISIPMLAKARNKIVKQNSF